MLTTSRSSFVLLFFIGVLAALWLLLPTRSIADDPEIPGLEGFATRIADASPTYASAAFKALLVQLQPAEANTPGLELGDLAGQLTADGVDAGLDERLALEDLASAHDTAGFVTALPALLRPMFDLAQSGPDNSLGLYALGLGIKEAEGQGISDVAILGVSPTPAATRTFAQAVQAQLNNVSAAVLEKMTAADIASYIQKAIGLLPKYPAPALTSPAGVFFDALMKWDQDMWQSTTDGLSLVSNAIQTGKLDMAAYQKLAQHLEALGRTGPWTTKTGTDFLVKTTSAVPTIGKFLPTLWGAFSKAKFGPAQPSLPVVTAMQGQFPLQSFSFALGAAGSVTLLASPAYQVSSDGTFNIGLVKISPDALPPYLEAKAPIDGGGEEAHRWAVYPEQQVVSVTVNYDNGSATGQANGGFGLQLAAPAGAASIVGIDLTFAPLGNTVVLHWPANIILR